MAWEKSGSHQYQTLTLKSCHLSNRDTLTDLGMNSFTSIEAFEYPITDAQVGADAANLIAELDRNIETFPINLKY